MTKPPAPQKPSLSVLLAELKSLGERTGGVVGGAYALAARSLLTRVERLEDRHAERRHAQRVQSAAAQNAAATPRPAELPPPPAK